MILRIYRVITRNFVPVSDFKLTLICLMTKIHEDVFCHSALLVLGGSREGCFSEDFLSRLKGDKILNKTEGRLSITKSFTEGGLKLKLLN